MHSFKHVVFPVRNHEIKRFDGSGFNECKPSFHHGFRLYHIKGKIQQVKSCGIAGRFDWNCIYDKALGYTSGEHHYRRSINAVSYTHLRAHETRHDLVCRLLLEKKKKKKKE